jgi:hypothetical protein
MDEQLPQTELSAPRVLPIARDTWEVDILLTADQEASGRVPLNFPYPGVLLGVKCTVVQNTDVGGGLFVPTTDDIKLSLDINEERRFTRTVRTNVVGQSPTSFVTLSAMDLRERFLALQLMGATPDVGLEVRWKRFTAGTPLFEDALVSLAFFVQREGSSGV